MHDKSEKVRRVSQLVVLSSLTIVLRVVFGPFPNIKPLTAIFLIVLSYFSLLESWILMILVMVGSGLLFGFGTVVLWQVLILNKNQKQTSQVFLNHCLLTIGFK
ncbi:hypothetical protein NF430_09320, partial [Streptococcus suis]|nr:hypothetical protein [Streptococcus suis]